MTGGSEYQATGICGYCGSNVDVKGPKCVKCVNCGAVFHLSCSGRVKTIRAVENQPKSVICCNAEQACSVQCRFCKKRINLRYDDAIKCKECGQLLHIGCAAVDIDRYQELRESGEILRWTCDQCADGTGDIDRDESAILTDDKTTTPEEDPLNGSASNPLNVVLNEQAPVNVCLEKILHELTKPRNCNCEVTINRFITEVNSLKKLVQLRTVENKTLHDELRTMSAEFKAEITGLKTQLFELSKNLRPDILVPGVGESETLINRVPNVKKCAPVTIDDGKPPEKRPGLGRSKSSKSSSIASTASKSLARSTAPAVLSVSHPSSASQAPAPPQSETLQHPITLQHLQHCLGNVAGSGPQRQLSHAAGAVNAVNERVDASGVIDGFKTVTYKRQRQKSKQIIVGNADDGDGDCGIRAVRRKLWFHVSRLPLDTETEKVKQYIQRKFSLENCDCEKVIPKNPDKVTYSSFKVGIEDGGDGSFVAPGMWPRGIAVSRWFFPRKPVVSPVQ